MAENLSKRARTTEDSQELGETDAADAILVLPSALSAEQLKEIEAGANAATHGITIVVDPNSELIASVLQFDKQTRPLYSRIAEIKQELTKIGINAETPKCQSSLIYMSTTTEQYGALTVSLKSMLKRNGVTLTPGVSDESRTFLGFNSNDQNNYCREISVTSVNTGAADAKSYMKNVDSMLVSAGLTCVMAVLTQGQTGRMIIRILDLNEAGNAGELPPRRNFLFNRKVKTWKLEIREPFTIEEYNEMREQGCDADGKSCINPSCEKFHITTTNPPNLRGRGKHKGANFVFIKGRSSDPKGLKIHLSGNDRKAIEELKDKVDSPRASMASYSPISVAMLAPTAAFATLLVMAMAVLAAVWLGLKWSEEEQVMPSRTTCLRLAGYFNQLIMASTCTSRYIIYKSSIHLLG
eukprot:CAMPEP_0180007496 /NCGR_PEP_ID=MMETSP0984-20121128/13951_1 /TAXON_ID=483367 /ORGANISM="non described non described, Strain CCMP 2436" /LENGTH=409 /DNA_ID=CAMNT_0021928661 /DNA_START=87 /DNA_END=1317 /DNA_ORIENTATION=-